MVENYMKNKVLQNEFSNTKVYIVLKNELPYKIFLTFESDELCKSFIDKYNQKFFEETVGYKLNIELSVPSINPEVMKSEILKSEESKNPYIFDFPYENEWWLDYVSQPEKPGLLYKNEEAKKKIYKTAAYLVKKNGKKYSNWKINFKCFFSSFYF